MQYRRRGFTLIELMIVIVIIAILATLTIISYNSAQQSGRDSKVRDGAQKIAEAIETWSAQTGLNPITAYTGSGSSAPITTQNGQSVCTPSSATGTGWITQSVGVSGYGCTLEMLLTNTNYLPTGYIDGLPYNTKFAGSAGHTYMIYQCGSTADFVLFYSLENPSNRDTSNYNSLSSKCGNTSPSFATLTSSYNMQGARLLNFSK